MPRNKGIEPDNADDVDLAPRVTPQQLTELYARGWRGPTPSTAAQASAILERIAAAPVGPDQGRSEGTDRTTK